MPPYGGVKLKNQVNPKPSGFVKPKDESHGNSNYQNTGTEGHGGLEAKGYGACTCIEYQHQLWIMDFRNK